MKINYKSKSKILAWVVFNNSSNSFMLSALVFSLSALILCFVPHFDGEAALILPAIISAAVFAITLAVQMIVYARSAKSVDVADERLVIHFGFKEYGRGGYAEINKEIKLDSIISCTVENEYTPLKIHKFFMLKYDNEAYNEFRVEIQNGNYEMPYLKISLQGNQALYLPVEDAKALCDIINERKQLLK